MTARRRSPRAPGAPGASVAALAAAAACLVILACHHGNVPLPSLAAAAPADSAVLLARGEYIVRSAAACGQCHAEPDSAPAPADSVGRGNVNAPLAGGVAFKDWRIGTVHAANLTPDSATGLGKWSDAEIVRAIRNGESRDGRLLAPVMPYAWLHGMSDEDALAVARYLKSLPPVRHAVSEHPSLTFKIARSTMLGPVSGTGPTTAPPRGATAEYGGYLAQHVSICVDCHTARSGLEESPDRHHLFAGDASPPKGFPANPANLTPDSATGIGRWSEEEFLRTIRTGVNPKGDTLDPFMPWRDYRHMTDDDLRAIYRYLRTLPPVRREIPRAKH